MRPGSRLWQSRRLWALQRIAPSAFLVSCPFASTPLRHTFASHLCRTHSRLPPCPVLAVAFPPFSFGRTPIPGPEIRFATHVAIDAAVVLTAVSTVPARVVPPKRPQIERRRHFREGLRHLTTAGSLTTSSPHMPATRPHPYSPYYPTPSPAHVPFCSLLSFSPA